MALGFRPIQPISFSETVIPFDRSDLMNSMFIQDPFKNGGSFPPSPHGLPTLVDDAPFPAALPPWMRDLHLPKLPMDDSQGIVDAVLEDEDQERPTMHMISTLKRRKLKMNKHKHKKRLKKTRALRKRLGKIK